MNKFITFFKIILYPIYRLIFWYTVEGKENLPKDKGFVFCSNHLSVLDPVLWIIVIRRRIHFMGKEELFKNKVTARFLKLLDVFAIKRGSGDMKSIEFATDIVKNGEILGIFPEGTRSKDGTPGRAKSGAAYIAIAANADVIPAAVVCKGKPRPFKRIKLVIGKPIPKEALVAEGGARSSLRKASNAIMGEISSIREKNML